MKLYHRVPCNECPWRVDSPAGWLGGHEPEFYADALPKNEVPACHLRDFGPTSPKTAFCAGALATAHNSATSLYRSPGADEASKEVGKRQDCFRFATDFYQYHAGKPYVHPVIRQLKKRKSRS